MDISKFQTTVLLFHENVFAFTRFSSISLCVELCRRPDQQSEKLDAICPPRVVVQ